MIKIQPVCNIKKWPLVRFFFSGLNPILGGNAATLFQWSNEWVDGTTALSFVKNKPIQKTVDKLQ
jgi:hypothetical protein